MNQKYRCRERDKSGQPIPMLATHVPPAQASDGVYDAAVASWLAFSPGKEAIAFYRAEVFPRSCQRIRPEGDSQDRLLFVPIGTQPYAPILAALANPSQIVVALYTKESAEYLSEVIESLEEENPRIEPILVDGYDGSDIVRKVQSAYDTFGQPDPNLVTVDQTGGTKPMSSALAGVAALNRWDLIYIKGKHERQHQGYAHHETLLRLSNPFQQFGGFQRVLALQLAQQGEFAGAARCLREALADSVAGAGYQLHLERFRLAQAYREANCEAVARSLPRLAKRIGAPLPEATRALLSKAPSDYRGLLYWMARCLSQEGKALACSSVTRQLGSDGADARKFLSAFRLARGSECRLSAWKPIDDLLGSGYRRELDGLGSL